MRFKRALTLLTILAGAVLVLGSRTGFGSRFVRHAFGGETDRGVTEDVQLIDGWRVSEVRTFADGINAMFVAPRSYERLAGLVYLGVGSGGSVLRFVPGSKGESFIISGGMGDQLRFGTCSVNRLAMHDIDGDGKPELLASSSQIEPRGRPRLAAFSSAPVAPVPKGVARPEIGSSWSHGVEFLDRPGGVPASTFVTFCGFGEVVEYRHEASRSGDGFRDESLSWKQVGQLPASGEWIQVADADNDGAPDVCVAAGYAVNKAEIHLYASDAPGATLRLESKIDEGHRFGNVRFLVGAWQPDGRRDLVAWWCTDLAGGDAEMIAYRLGPQGVTSRTVLETGPAGRWWPDDGQFSLGDLDGDGRDEVWFCTHAGYLWRFAPSIHPRPELVAKFSRALGPLAIGPGRYDSQDRLYVAIARTVFLVEPVGPRPELRATRLVDNSTRPR